MRHSYPNNNSKHRRGERLDDNRKKLGENGLKAYFKETSTYENSCVTGVTTVLFSMLSLFRLFFISVLLVHSRISSNLPKSDVILKLRRESLVNDIIGALQVEVLEGLGVVA
jgi:hypothetical protein